MSRAQQQEVVAASGRRGGAAMAARRRFDDDGDEPSTTAAAAAAGCRCRSCAAVALADCVALGCCPCAVVSLLGLALVRAPIAVGRRCVGRLRRRRRLLLRRKRVRDVDASVPAAADVREKIGADNKGELGVVVEAMLAGDGGERAAEEEELAWLEQMFRMGHWGFGRVSLSLENPVKAT